MTPSESTGPRWKPFTVWLAVSGYWLATYLSSRIQALVGGGAGDGVPVIAAVFFSLVILCMLTERTGWNALKCTALVPASLVAHALLTVPAAAALGILMFDPEHARTAAEQRAVFILASLPILAAAMWRSRLFVSDPAGPRATRPSG